MQFKFEINSEAVDAALEALSASIETGEQAREATDDFRDLLATPASTTRSRGRTTILGPGELGEAKKASN